MTAERNQAAYDGVPAWAKQKGAAPRTAIPTARLSGSPRSSLAQRSQTEITWPGGRARAKTQAAQAKFHAKLYRSLRARWFQLTARESKVQGPMSKVARHSLDFDPSPWTLDFGRWTLDLGHWTLDLGPLDLGPWTNWTLHIGLGPLAPWPLDLGKIGPWPLDIGRWTLDFNLNDPLSLTVRQRFHLH